MAHYAHTLQHDQLTAAGVDETFIDKASGKIPGTDSAVSDECLDRDWYGIRHVAWP